MEFSTHIDNRRDDLYIHWMSQALFSVIGGSLVNLAKVTHIENSTIDKGKVMVHFDNKDTVVLDGTMESVLLKIGGNRDDANRAPAPPPPTHKPGGGRQ